MRNHPEFLMMLLSLSFCIILIGQPVWSEPAPWTPAPSILLAQAEDEGDIDESYNSYGADTDEEIEYDEAIISPEEAAEKKAAPGAMTAVDSLIRGIRWLGHASFLIEGGIAIYIDPYSLPEGLPPADLVLITHDHRDHFSPGDLNKILKPTTVVVSVKSVCDNLPTKAKNSRTVAPGDTISVGEVSIAVVPAYNIKKDFHPKENGWVGFVIEVEGRSIYHAGDTDLIPEMKHIDADVALLPAGGTYTMDADEAAKAANLIKPQVAIPMHWGTIVGSEEDAKAFKTACKVPALILKDESKQVKVKEE
ncbi:MAG: MBL fold metallo-hydrolase [Candidatus Eisenbacteria bacterium]